MINGINKDGFAYVLYINGGHQQWMILYPFEQKSVFGSKCSKECMILPRYFLFPIINCMSCKYAASIL